MINDIYEYNRKVQAHNERVMEQIDESECAEDYKVAIFDSAHPILSLFCNWFANRK